MTDWPIYLLMFTGIAMAVSMSAFAAMVIARAVQNRPELAEIEPLSLRIISRLSTFLFFSGTAAALFLFACCLLLAGLAALRAFASIV